MRMAHKSAPHLINDHGMIIVRCVLALTMIIHGVARIVLGGVAPFGEFLASKGFPFGTALALLLTLFELIGGATLLARRYVVVLAALFAVELVVGIILVHGPEGWFVVGAGRNGMEYSAVLIAGFIAVIASERQRQKLNA